MKKSILLPLLVLSTVFSYAQDDIKMQVKKAKIIKKNETPEKDNFKIVKGTISFGFKINAPSNKATVSQNVPIEGTAKPGTLVKIVIDSRYQTFNGTDYKAGPSQSFYATANQSGKWKTDPVDFQIVHTNYSKVEYSIQAKEENGKETAQSVVYVVANSSSAVSLFEITKPLKLTAAPPAEMALPMPRGTSFRIEGKGAPRSKIVVEVRYDGETIKIKDPFVLLPGEKNITKHDKKLLDTWELTVNSDGTWRTQFIKTFEESKDDYYDEVKKYMYVVYVTVRVMDNDKEVVTKKLILPCSI